MKRTTINVFLLNIVIFLFIHFTLLQPIKYRHIKGKVIEGDIPNWKIRPQNKNWKGYRIRGYFCLFRILYCTSDNPDSIYKNIEKNIKKTEIYQNIKIFNNGIIGIKKRGIGKKGYRILSSFSFKHRVFSIGMYTSSTSKKYFNAFIHFLESLKIDGIGVNSDVASQLELLSQKIPLYLMQEDKFIESILIFLFLLIPLIMITKILFDGRLPTSPPPEIVKQEGYVDVFVNYGRMKTEAFTGSVVLTYDTLFLFKNRKIFKKIALKRIQQDKKYLLYKDKDGKILKILPRNINDYKSFLAR